MSNKDDIFKLDIYENVKNSMKKSRRMTIVFLLFLVIFTGFYFTLSFSLMVQWDTKHGYDVIDQYENEISEYELIYDYCVSRTDQNLIDSCLESYDIPIHYQLDKELYIEHITDKEYNEAKSYLDEDYNPLNNGRFYLVYVMPIFLLYLISIALLSTMFDYYLGRVTFPDIPCPNCEEIVPFTFNN